MDFKLIFLCILIITFVSAFPSEGIREKRDIFDSIKSAWNDVVKTMSDAGDAVVHVFKPTEKSVIDKVADGFKSLSQ
ncbi:uncharacterized protein LOC115446271 [Manduca sexta]|uniref:Uncharacterized protein n=1 Tax=Manduca sexta TaxID=7130 RepID=A0A921ZBL4_MANSE|nr:uncharacterized protein LOC115446271 [Manduca sexta]KAG6454421.1 hypothetical protein O3G_MSEX008695 [Manduca sexta]